jgi:hypothetical protein
LDDETTTTTTPTPLFGLEEKSIVNLETLTTEIETWLKKKLAVQEKLALWDEPVLNLSDLEKKGDQIQAALRKILLQQAKAKTTSKKSSSSKTTSTTSTSASSETTPTTSAAAEETPVYSEVEDDMDETITTTATVRSVIIEDEPEATEGTEIKHEEL